MKMVNRTYCISSTDVFLENVANIVQSLDEKYTILLPNRRSCRELSKYLQKERGHLPQLMAISDLLAFEDMTLTLAKFLKENRQNVPFNTLYELSESLYSLMKELTLNKVNPGQLTSIIPADLQKYWHHTIAIIDAAMKIPEIKRNLDLTVERLNTFLKITKSIVAVGIREVNFYAKLFLREAQNNGIVITEDLNLAQSNNIEFLEFNSVFEEGYAVAFAVNKAVSEQKSVLVVSLDQSIAEIIKSELRHWNIFADDSRGIPFSKTPDGILVSLIIDMMERQYDVVSAISVLKMNSEFLSVARELELFFRQRQVVPHNFFAAFKLYPEKNANPRFQVLIEEMCKISTDSSETFFERFNACCKLTALINTESAEKLREVSSKFLQDSVLSIKIDLREFSVFLKNRIIWQPVRDAKGYTPNVLILGPIEAQLLEADFIVISGANEESWSKSLEKNDFWMSKSMIEHFGMQTPEMKNEFLQNIFARLVCKKNALITRSTLVEGTRQQKYRYFDKIAEDLKVRKAELLEQELSYVKRSCEQKAIAIEDPKPDLNLRPRDFSASDFNLLIRSPYAFYAKNILKLKEIGRINELTNVYGNYVHNVLAESVKNAKDLTDLKKLKEIADKILKNKLLDPSNFGLRFFRLDKIWSFVVENMNANNSFYSEILGNTFIKISDDYTINVKCRADRIDADEFKNVSIIDYKTGLVPSRNKIFGGKEIQLPIAAIVAENGGFGLKKTNVASLCYWELKGAAKRGKITVVAANEEEVEKAKEKARDAIVNLMQKYNIRGEAYSIADSSFEYEKSYEHLARVKEIDSAR